MRREKTAEIRKKGKRKKRRKRRRRCTGNGRRGRRMCTGSGRSGRGEEGTPSEISVAPPARTVSPRFRKVHENMSSS